MMGDAGVCKDSCANVVLSGATTILDVHLDSGLVDEADNHIDVLQNVYFELVTVPPHHDCGHLHDTRKTRTVTASTSIFIRHHRAASVFREFLRLLDVKCEDGSANSHV